MVYWKKEKNKNVSLGPKMNFILSDDNDKNANRSPIHWHAICMCLQLHNFTFPQIVVKCKLIQAFMAANHETLNSELVPLWSLPSADLCITRSKGSPSNRELLRSFINFFRTEMESSIFLMSKCTVLKANHFPDDKIFLTPDLYAWHKPGMYPNPT